MANLPQVGLEAVIEGLDKFIQGSKAMEEAFEYVAKAEAKLAKESPEAAQAVEMMVQEFLDSGGDIRDMADRIHDAVGDIMTPMEQLAALVGAGAIQQVAGTLGRVGDQMLGLAKDSVMTAARIEELDFVLGNLAEQNDLSADAMREQVEAIRAQGIQADVAYGLVTQFVQANLDLSKASELARLAQDAAVISMEDSSQALAGLVHGITTLQPEMLRYRGIIVDLQGEYKRWADAHDRSILSLTSMEKQQIALDAALAQGSEIAGTYESAMESASKQLRSMPRYVADLKAELGESLLPVYSDAVFATKDLLKWLGNLPPTVKSVVAATGTMTGGLFKLTSTMVGTGAQIAQLIIGLQALQGTAAASALAFLGPLGLVAGLLAVVGVGVVTAVKAHEQAQKDEAEAILANADVYSDYIQRLEDAGLEAYAFSEELYNLIKAKEDTDEAFDTDQLTDARDRVQDLADAVMSASGMYDQFDARAMTEQLDDMKDVVDRAIPSLDDMQLQMLADSEQARLLGENAGLAGQWLEFFTAYASAAAQEALDFGAALENVSNVHEVWTERIPEFQRSVQGFIDDMVSLKDEMLYQQQAAQAVVDAFEDFDDAVGDVTPEVRRLRNELAKLASEEGLGAAILMTKQMMADAVQGAEDEIASIRDKAQKDQERALADHLKREEGLYDDYQDRVADILEGLAEIDKDLLEGRAEAEAQLQADRLALVAEAAQAMAELMAQQAEELADLQEQLEKDLARINEDYQDARRDAAESLADDLAEIDEALVEREKAVWDSYYEALEDLAEDHGQRMAAITEKYANERERIEDKYRTTATRQEEIDAEREALLKELEELRKLKTEGMTGIDYTEDIKAVMAALDKLKQEELDGLAEREEAAKAAEEEAYQERLKLAEDRREEMLAAERESAEKARRERQDRYDEQLDDLREAHDEQLAERRRAYEERKQALLEAQEAERAAQERRAAEALAQLDDRHAQELARMEEQAANARESLRERLADEQQNYNERQAALDEAYAEQQATINEKMDQQVQTTKDKADEVTRNLIQAWEGIDPAIGNALQGVYDNQIRPWVDRVLDEIRRLKSGIETELESSPKSGWFEKVGKSMVRGLESGFDLKPVLDAQLNVMSGFQQQTVQAAVPPQMAAAAGGASSVDNSRSYNLNYTGQPQGEASIRSLLTLMEMRANG